VSNSAIACSSSSLPSWLRSRRCAPDAAHCESSAIALRNAESLGRPSALRRIGISDHARRSCVAGSSIAWTSCSIVAFFGPSIAACTRRSIICERKIGP
jgi:hypothetical protein